MHIFATVEPKRVIFRAQPSATDEEFGREKKVKLGRLECFVALPEAARKHPVHPDALALAALLLYGPFVAKDLSLDWTVSRGFADAVSTHLRRRIEPSSEAVPARFAPARAVDALAFSGGIDSVAALVLMPDSTVPVFMNRMVPEGIRGGLYRGDAALKSCADVAASGRDVHVLDTDMEFVRDPVGFSVDWTNSVGTVLLADILGLRSVAFGMVQESAFFLGHGHFSELADRRVYRNWAPLFEAIDLPIALPTAGLSEVLTSVIAGTVNGSWSAQSCVRGAADNPCGRCFKCFRKKILDARLSGRRLPATHFDVVAGSREVKRRLLETPIHHENVLAYSLNGLQCDGHALLDVLKEKTGPVTQYGDGLDLLERYNPSFWTYVPNFLRQELEISLGRFCAPMSPDERTFVQGWDLEPIVASPEYAHAQRKLEGLLA